jgi:hypothetical protein
MPERGRHLRGDALLLGGEEPSLLMPSLDSDGLLFETGTEVLGDEEDKEELRSRRLLEIPATMYDEEDEIGKLATTTPVISGILVTLTHGWNSNELCAPPDSKLSVLDGTDMCFS